MSLTCVRVHIVPGKACAGVGVGVLGHGALGGMSACVCVFACPSCGARVFLPCVVAAGAGVGVLGVGGNSARLIRSAWRSCSAARSRSRS